MALQIILSWEQLPLGQLEKMQSSLMVIEAVGGNNFFSLIHFCKQSKKYYANSIFLILRISNEETF